MKLRLTRLLLPGTERHGTPRSVFRFDDPGDSPRARLQFSKHPAQIAGSTPASLIDRTAIRPESSGREPKSGRAGFGQNRFGCYSIASRAATKARQWTEKARGIASPMRTQANRWLWRKSTSGKSKTQNTGKASATGHRSENGF